MAQFGRPDSDVAAGTWTATPLYDKINETPYSDTDYISGPNKSSSTCELGLSDVTDPSSSSSHTMRVRGYKTGTGDIQLTIELYQGTTLIKSWVPTWTGAFASYEYTLSSGEADSITDYTNLRVKCVQTYTTGAQGRSYVSWFEFEVPDVVTTSLTIENATQSQTAENTGLTYHALVITQETTQTQTADLIQLKQNYKITTVFDATQAQTADSIVLIHNYLLFLNNSTQYQTADNLTLTAYPPPVQVVPDSATQLQTSDNIFLTQHQILTIYNATQTQTTSNILLAQHYISIINNAIQAQSADNILLTQNYNLIAYNSEQAQIASSVILTQHYSITTNGASQLQTSDNVSLTQHHLLAMYNAVQVQTSSNISLAQGSLLVVYNASQIQTTEDITLIQNYVLIVIIATQLQVSSNITLGGGGVTKQMVYYIMMRRR